MKLFPLLSIKKAVVEAEAVDVATTNNGEVFEERAPMESNPHGDVVPNPAIPCTRIPLVGAELVKKPEPNVPPPSTESFEEAVVPDIEPMPILPVVLLTVSISP